MLIPLILGWWNIRSNQIRDHREAAQQRNQQHLENQVRLREIETKIDPLWKWWNKRINP
jgi:hypothetical protein